eukprot:scaffold12331_cov56-Phaeocystis_antarctica.AAC.3
MTTSSSSSDALSEETSSSSSSFPSSSSLAATSSSGAQLSSLLREVSDIWIAREYGVHARRKRARSPSAGVIRRTLCGIRR